jgi:hypothetical protein
MVRGESVRGVGGYCHTLANSVPDGDDHGDAQRDAHDDGKRHAFTLTILVSDRITDQDYVAHRRRHQESDRDARRYSERDCDANCYRHREPYADGDGLGLRHENGESLNDSVRPRHGYRFADLDGTFHRCADADEHTLGDAGRVTAAW